MKKTLIVLMLATFCTTNTFAQNTPSYPEPKEGYKRVNLIFPKIENSNQYKVEVRFGMQMELYPCSKAGFNFISDALIKDYGIKDGRFPYYDLTTNQAEVFEGFMDDNCKKENYNNNTYKTILMKEKTLVQIWGKANSGKTSTIKMISYELKKELDKTLSYSFSLEKDEIFEIFDFKGFKIGISSMGDVLHDYLKHFLNNCFDECDIIIAASRVYNDVNNFLDDKCLEKSFRKIKVTNYRIRTESKETQFKFNEVSAKHIHELINQILLGEI